jgi:hypothetical protein
MASSNSPYNLSIHQIDIEKLQIAVNVQMALKVHSPKVCVQSFLWVMFVGDVMR